MMTPMAPWQERRLGDISSMGSGGTPPSNTPRFYGGGVSWVSIADMTAGGKYISNTQKTLSLEGLANSAAKLYDPDVVLYAMYASLGECSIARGRVSSSQAILGITPGDDLNSEFLYYYLEFIKPFVKTMGQHGTQANLNAGMVRNFRIMLPGQQEQERITRALAETDELIDTLERLITKKQAIKQGMMQQLLTHRAGNKDTAPLGSVTSWLSGGTPNRSNSDYWSGTIPWISATTLKRLEVAASDQHVTPAAVRAGSKMAPVGSTLILVRGSALHSEIRASLVTGPVCFNQDVKALVPSRKVVPRFLTYSIHGNADKILRLVTSAGNTAGVLDTQVVKSFEIWLPNRSEQLRLVTVLDDVSSEIDVLTSRLLKAKAIKQGMMQELLTGRTRLPIAEGAA